MAANARTEAQIATYDLVSVGGGFAGLVAAVRGAELGLRVAVLEAGTQERYACNSRYSGGIFHASYQDVQLPPEKLLQGILKAEAQDAELAGTIAAHAGRALDWLRTRGARFVYFANLKRGPWIMAPPRAPVSAMEWANRGPDATLRALTTRLHSLGGSLYLGTRATELSLRDGRCVGVSARGPAGEQHLPCRAVVLADGGFAGNAQLFRRYIGPSPDRVVQRGAATGRGDALTLADQAGAAFSDLSRFYGHLLSRDALHNDALWPYPQIDAVAAAGIVVGPDGQRFMDEGLGGIYATNHLAGLPDPACATVILDARIWDEAGRIGVVAPNPIVERHGGTVLRASSIAQLARAAGLPEQALVQTVSAYNDALQSGTLNALSPARSQAKSTAMPIVHAPFMAIPICAGITNTMGGPRINGHAQVLRADHNAIAGLYAAGAATGGLEGGPGVGYVGGLVKAVVFGLRAAEHAAAGQGGGAGDSQHRSVAP